MRDYLFQIVLFLAGAVIGIAVPLLHRTTQKRIAAILAAIMVAASLIWAGYELGIREANPAIAIEPITGTPTPTLVPPDTPTPGLTNIAAPPTNRPLPPSSHTPSPPPPTTPVIPTNTLVVTTTPTITSTVTIAPVESSTSSNAQIPTPILNDKGRIAFQSDRDGNFEIYMMNTEGNEQTRLTFNQPYDGEPSWSPDGTRIAFAFGDPPSLSSEWSWLASWVKSIYVINIDSHEIISLASGGSFENLNGGVAPTWSPNGTLIAFESFRDRNAEIYVMNSDGSDQRRLTRNLNGDGFPFWSPDGRRIVFVSDRDENPEIYVMNADGSEQKRLTDNQARDWMPAWSPDGSQIAFMSNRDGNDEIYLMNVEGGELKRLTNVAGYDGEPSWSPDGRAIVFVSDRDGNREIYKMQANGNEQINLTNNPATDQRPSWSQ